MFYAAVSALVADMVLKHLFYVMPLICLGVGAAGDWIWRRARPGRYVVWGMMLLLTIQAADRWYFYIFEKRH